VTPLALPGDVTASFLDRLVQFSLVNRVLKRQGVNGPGPLFKLFRVAITTRLRRSEGNSRLVPFHERWIIRIELRVHVKNPGVPERGPHRHDRNHNKKPQYSPDTFHKALLLAWDLIRICLCQLQ
jgi:hypothetical protein